MKSPDSAAGPPVAPTPAARKAVKAAGLRYASDASPGILRKRDGNNFSYVDPAGKVIRQAETLARIKSLVIPPAWENVWICPWDNGHLQATGRDARGRKQYRYHADWRAQRDDTKFHHILSFARQLPKIRRRVNRDLKCKEMSRDKVLATVVRLLETTLIRIGNDEYARQNGSYGLTTMHNRHVKVKGAGISFSFKGKSGKRHQISVQDKVLARTVRRCQDLPGQELFAYEDEEGGVHDVTSQDVNEYLRAIAGAEFTAKDFRTWAGTVLAALALREFEVFTSQTQAKKNILTAIESVASMLGNTPAVCRKCYVHPGILNSYLQGATIETVKQRMSMKVKGSLRQLRPEEAAVFILLQRKLSLDAGKTAGDQ